MNLQILNNNVLENNSVNIENERYFKQEYAKWQEYFFSIPGSATVNLVAPISDAQAGYLHYLEISARHYNNDEERWQTVLKELTAQEFIYVNMYAEKQK